MIRKTIKLIVPLLIVAGVFSGYKYLQTFKKAPKENVSKEIVYNVDSLLVAPSDHIPVQQLYGQVNNQKIVTLAAPSAGEVQKVSVSSGEWVSQGKELIALHDSDFDLRINRAKVGISETNATIEQIDLDSESLKKQLSNQLKLLDLFERKFTREQSMNLKKFSTQERLETAEQNYLQQSLVVDQVEDNIEALRVQRSRAQADEERKKIELEDAYTLKDRSVRISNEDSLILEVLVQSGATVNAGTPLVRMMALNDFEVVASLIGAQAIKIIEALEKGEEVLANVTYLGKLLRFKLARIQGSADNGSLVGVFIPLSREKEDLKLLRLGISLPIDLYRPVEPNSIGVPFSALYGRDKVYAIQENRLKEVKVSFLGVIEVPIQNEKMQLWALVRSSEIIDRTEILTTYLPNAANGIAVKKVYSQDQ